MPGCMHSIVDVSVDPVALDGCTALRDLQLAVCQGAREVPLLRCFSQLTCLALAGCECSATMWERVLPHTPQLRVLDASCNLQLSTAPGPVPSAAQLQRWCPRLRDMYLEPAEMTTDAEIGDAILQAQRAVPHIR